MTFPPSVVAAKIIARNNPHRKAYRNIVGQIEWTN
jgi:hypothetical protein